MKSPDSQYRRWRKSWSPFSFPWLVLVPALVFRLQPLSSTEAFLVPTLVLHKNPRSNLREIHHGEPLSPSSFASPFRWDVILHKKKETRRPPTVDQAGNNVASLAAATATTTSSPPDLDAMRARAGVLRRSILQQQLELQQLERQIICCSSNTPLASFEDKVSYYVLAAWNRALATFQASTNVLLRKINRVQSRAQQQQQLQRRNDRLATSSRSITISSSNNNNNNNDKQKYTQHQSLTDFFYAQTSSGVRIVDRLWKNQTQLMYMLDPETPTLVPHVPAILARLDRLESHVAPILERVLNNQRHLASIEPYLPQILERFDDIEPHLPWILDHIDVLAPYTGLLLKHIDELLPYAQLDDHEGVQFGTQYALAEQLLPYLEFYVSRLDTVGPHLPLLRPHVPKLLKHSRIAKMSSHIDRLFALGYKDNLGASANMDVLLFWFGWALNVPGLPKLFFALPGSPRIVTFLANRLPKRFVRGYCSGVSCYVDGDYGIHWNKCS